MEPTEEATYRKSIDEKLDRIIIQTTKTNGSVAAAQEKIAEVELSYKIWRAYITGAVSVILFLMVSIAIPLLSGWISR